MFCSRTLGIWLLKKKKKKHNANCRNCCCDFMSTDQGHFFCMYYFVYTSASTSRENFMASRRADKHTTHEKTAILGNASTERYLFIWHLHVGHTVFARMVWFVVLMSPSALSIAPSPSRMDSLTPTASFSAHMYFWRLDIQWIVASLQWREFCPVCFNIYLFLSHSPPQAFFLADFSHQHCVCWETTTPRGECWRGGRNRSKSIYWM